jgi:hypothetical protein
VVGQGGGQGGGGHHAAEVVAHGGRCGGKGKRGLGRPRSGG